MMLATNWGVYEICVRHAKFIKDGDHRDMEIRARSQQHLRELHDRFPEFITGIVALTDGTADFQYRAFISRPDLAVLLASLPPMIDYVQFKKDAKDTKLHSLLSRFWTVWLDAYPKGSVYSTPSKGKHGRSFRSGAPGSFFS